MSGLASTPTARTCRRSPGVRSSEATPGDREPTGIIGQVFIGRRLQGPDDLTRTSSSRHANTRFNRIAS
jgi:hypothetical protein